MDRKEFFHKSIQAGLCCCASLVSENPAAAQDSGGRLAELEREKQFIQNWLADLMETIDTELDESAKIKLMAGCGKGCYRRFPFKQDIARQGAGSLEKLMEAYRKNFEIWREGDLVHIRYGEVSKGCYCPAARYRPAKPHDLHCECTRATHQTIFETALDRPFQVDILETLRRGGKTCHFVVHVA